MKKNLLNPTPSQIKYRNRLWADALLKNKKKATHCMRDGKGGSCCLAVASTVAKNAGVNIPKDPEDSGYYDYENFPHDNVVQFFGWDIEDPLLIKPDGERECASILNDDNKYSINGSNGMSHKKIAECVMNTFVNPKNIS